MKRWYRKAAKQGDRDAQFGIGTMGGTHGVSKEEALKGLMRSAEQGFGFAQIILAQRYEQGDGVEKDLAKARSLYEAALPGFPVRAKAGLDRIDAPELQAAIDALHKNDLAAAIDKALLLAQRGNVRAQSIVGSAYLTSKPPNFDAAHEWLSKSAEAGDIDAQFQLAILYSTGGGSIAANRTEAARWWQTCADRGDGGCAEFLGLAYAIGRGVPKDLQKARALLEQAVAKGVVKAKEELASVEALLNPAKQNDAPTPVPAPAPAPFGLAEAKELGLALRAYAQGDYATALAKGKPLAENGVPAAQKLLGDMYLVGKGGLQASESEARAWYEKAAAGGNSYARAALDKLNAKTGSSAPQ